MKYHKQLTYEQRCQIFVLKQEGCGQQAIANAIGVSQSTISRELKRNVGERGYRYKQAQKKSRGRRQQAVKPHKMTRVNIASIETKIKQE